MLSCGTLSCSEPAQGCPAGAAPLVPSGPGGLPRRLTPTSIPSCGQGRAPVREPAGHCTLWRSCSFCSWDGPWGSAPACSVLAGPRLGSLEGLLVGEEHASPTGKRSPAQLTLDRWEGLPASQGHSYPSRASQPVQPWDLGKLSQGVPQLEVMTFCFLLGRAVICILLREDSVPFLLGWLFFWVSTFFQISEQGHCPSPNTPDSTPPPGVRPLQPRSCWPSAPGLENISGPGPLPRSLYPICHPWGCWVSAQSHLWTDTVFFAYHEDLK